MAICPMSTHESLSATHPWMARIKRHPNAIKPSNHAVKALQTRLAVSATRVVVNAANTARTQRVKRKGAGKVRLERVASRLDAFIHSFYPARGGLSRPPPRDRSRAVTSRARGDESR